LVLFPARRLTGEPRRQRRLAGRWRIRLSRRHADLSLQLFLIGQTCELVHEHQRVLRRDLEFLPARLAGDLVIEAEQVIPQLGELGPVRIVGSGWELVLLRAPYPADAIFSGPSALGTLIPPGSDFCL